MYYSPDATSREESDGEETVPHVAQYSGGHELAGVYVWFEWGDWVDLGAFGWVWVSKGYTDHCYYHKPQGQSCFAAGTPILTVDGFRSIEQIKAGDWILSSPAHDPKAKPVASRVKEVIQSRGQLVEVSVGGQLVHASREHPFYVQTKGWTPARSLTTGDLLRSLDDRWLPVDSIVEAHVAPVFNVRLEGHATYFVGGCDWAFSLWVSAACARVETPLTPSAVKKSEPALVPNGHSR